MQFDCSQLRTIIARPQTTWVDMARNFWNEWYEHTVHVYHREILASKNETLQPHCWHAKAPCPVHTLVAAAETIAPTELLDLQTSDSSCAHDSRLIRFNRYFCASVALKRAFAKTQRQRSAILAWVKSLAKANYPPTCTSSCTSQISVAT